MTVTYRSPGVYRQDVFVRPDAGLQSGVVGFVGLASQAPGSRPARVISLRHRREFDSHLVAAPRSYLADAVSGFFENGGKLCFVAPAAVTGDPVVALLEALSALEATAEIDLVAIPDAMTLRLTGGFDLPAIVALQQMVIAHCGRCGDRLAILDAIPALPDAAAAPAADALAAASRLLEQARQLGMPPSGLSIGSADRFDAGNAALYFPWLQTESGRLIPPCGHVAGIYARSDAAFGFFKTPANEEVLGVVDLGVFDDSDSPIALQIDNLIQDQLNPAGINCLRSFRGRGIRVWGGRTLSSEASWRYINVRRVVLQVKRWIDSHLGWATFEPNSPNLWVRIQRELDVYLAGLWRSGALKGDTVQEAYFVKCDNETNPVENREQGSVITEIGLAALTQAEFIVLRITQRADKADVAQIS